MLDLRDQILVCGLQDTRTVVVLRVPLGQSEGHRGSVSSRQGCRHLSLFRLETSDPASASTMQLVVTRTSAHADLSSQLVLLPYNLLLQKSAREALGIDLKDQVVIIDEAHSGYSSGS